MQLNSDVLNKAVYVIGNAETVMSMKDVRPLRPFDDDVLSFFNALSRKLMTARTGYSDVSTFGFWCRKAHLEGEKAKYDEISVRLGRGVVFHSTPSNVAVNFAFSFAAGLLAGNANLVRLPAKSFPQVDIICDAINQLLDGDFALLKPYICMFRFAPDRELYDIFSALCDTRVIWGGDNTIAEIRGSALPPRANEITFADRFSVLMINSEGYMAAQDKPHIAQDFYNDTYFSDQNACTSPRIILWYGDKTEQAKQEFWDNAEKAAEKYEMQPVQAVGKLSAFYKAAVSEDITRIPTASNLVTRVKVNSITDTLMNHKYNSGFFYEYDVTSMEEIRPLFTKPCQTMSYIGFDRNELRKMVMDIRPAGIDRIVPVGKTMDFSLIWDGNDLIRYMSRVVDAE
ncbi:MAG: acyl-CoA reductase [Oscillospiraceae bacterium]